MIKQVAAGFTLDALLAHLRSQPATEPDGYRTAKEWAEHFELTVPAMMAILREAKGAGVLLCRRVYRERLDGVMSPVPVYAFDLGEGEEGAG